MTIKLRVPDVTELSPRITVFGVGGAGGNAVANMIRSELQGVEFVVANTDAQALAQSPADRRIQLGTSVTQGLGAGSRPEIGAAAAEESLDEVLEHLAGAHMAFITAGMGGGTGTGAAPIIARAAREQGILTVGVITKPFHFEGARRMRVAEQGIIELQQFVDTLIIIPNQNLFRIANEKTTFAQAFAMADEVLHSGVRGITDLMVMPGLINLDFADIRTVMNEMGKAMMGTGEAEGDNRAVEAAEAAISNPLLDEVSMKGARGVLIHITGGMDLTLFEVDEAANRIRSEVDPDANIIVGSTFAEQLEGRIRVSVVATGIDAEISQGPVDMPLAANYAAPRRLIRPMTSSSSAVTPGYNPVNATIRELAERVQELPGGAGEETSRARREESAPAHMTIAQAPPMPQATIQSPAMQVRAEPERRPAAAVPTASGGISVSATMQAPGAFSAGALGPAERAAPARAPAEPAEDPGSRKRRVSNILERMTAKTFLSGGDVPPMTAPAAPAPAAARERTVAEPAPQKPAAERSAPTLPREERGEGERHLQSSLEEEQLEIPTFLRRQGK
jgi:cell division protein FtsZ